MLGSIVSIGIVLGLFLLVANTRPKSNRKVVYVRRLSLPPTKKYKTHRLFRFSFKKEWCWTRIGAQCRSTSYVQRLIFSFYLYIFMSIRIFISYWFLKLLISSNWSGIISWQEELEAVFIQSTVSVHLSRWGNRNSVHDFVLGGQSCHPESGTVQTLFPEWG